MPTFGIFLILMGGLLATLSALNATILASSRVAFSMGRDWMLPNRLSLIHPSRKTPVMAISVTGFLFLAVAIFLPMETLGSCSSLLFLLTFSLVNLAHLMYRFRNKGERPPFRVPLFPLTPILGFVTCVALALYQLWNEPLVWVLAAGWILGGIVIFLVAFSRRVAIADVPKIIESPELLGLKKIKNYKVLLPLANPGRIESLVDMAGRIANVSQGEVLALSIVDLPNIATYSEADELLNEPQQVLNKAQQLALKRKIAFSSLLKIGRSTAPEIVQVALDNRCDLILLGYKKDEDPLENSIIHHVIAHQPCDVAILKSDRGGLQSFGRILVPIGGKDFNDSLKVRFVHGIYHTSACRVTLMMIVPLGAAKIQRKRAYESLQRAAKIYNISTAELLLEESDQIASAIISQANERDLLVLGLREEPWLQSFFFGTIAQQVAGQVPCPTLLIKPRAVKRSGLKHLLRVRMK
jgi:nucleotide-binding universal stress UspA family protein